MPDANSLVIDGGHDPSLRRNPPPDRLSSAPMHFDLVDRVLEQTSERIVTIKQVAAAEEYLQDHFPDFPVLPGVFMLEAMVQAGRRLLADRAGRTRLVLGGVRGVKYGTFVRPGQVMRVEVSLRKSLEGGVFELDGEARVMTPCTERQETPPIAAAGRLTLRPLAEGSLKNG